MVPDDDDWRKDELKRVNVCVCVCVCEREREIDKLKRRRVKLTKKPDSLPQRLWEFLNRGIIFFGGVLFLTQNFTVCW